MLCFVEMMLIIIMDRLDSDRDTEAEIESTVRFFPNVLSHTCRKGSKYYPIQCLALE